MAYSRFNQVRSDQALHGWLNSLRGTQPHQSIASWSAAVGESPLLRSQPDNTLRILEPMAREFLGRVPHTLQDGLKLEPQQHLRIAAEACLPIAHLGLGWYDNVREIVIYPGAFLVDQQWIDEDGIEHRQRAELAGEAWNSGPVVLAWEEIELGGSSGHEYYNVVIHEFAHVLDATNGIVNGFPPIKDAVLASRWPRVFRDAYDAECSTTAHGKKTILDEYATESPGEFFAVASEHFFTQPQRLQCHLPDLFDCLSTFYI